MNCLVIPTKCHPNKPWPLSLNIELHVPQYWKTGDAD